MNEFACRKIFARRRFDSSYFKSNTYLTNRFNQIAHLAPNSAYDRADNNAAMPENKNDRTMDGPA